MAIIDPKRFFAALGSLKKLNPFYKDEILQNQDEEAVVVPAKPILTPNKNGDMIFITGHMPTPQQAPVNFNGIMSGVMGFSGVIGGPASSTIDERDLNWKIAPYTHYSDQVRYELSLEWFDIIMSAIDKIETLGYGRPYLAGGAVRDLAFKQAPKDWDVFLLDQGEERRKAARSLGVKHYEALQKEMIFRVNEELQKHFSTLEFKGNPVTVTASTPSALEIDKYEEGMAKDSDVSWTFRRPLCNLLFEGSFSEKDKYPDEFRRVQVQVMYRPDRLGIADLLSQFDWNVCSYGLAYGKDGQMQMFSSETPELEDPNKPPSKTNLFNPTRFGGIITLNEDYANKCKYPQYTLWRGHKFAQRLGMKMARNSYRKLIKEIHAKIIAKEEAEQQEDPAIPF